MFARRGLALLALLAHVQAFQHGAVLYRPQLKSSVSKAAVCSRNTRPVCVASRLCCQAGALEQDAATELSIVELERLFEERIAKVAPAILEMLNAGPGSMAVVDNLLGLDQTTEMRREAVAVTERGLLRGSASAYSTAPPETFEERYGDEPGISATVLTPGTVAGELSPRCGAYITAASRVLSRVLGGARRGTLEHAEDGVTDHQLRLTTVAQQAHMDNAFDGENRRLITTIYYLNPAWVSEDGGRFLPWPCADQAAADSARAAALPSTLLSFAELPPEAQAQIPPSARDNIRLSITRKLAPAADYEATMAKSRRPQAPVEPMGDRLIAFYSDELMHSVEPVGRHPLIRDGDSLRVDQAGRFAISLWLPAPTASAISSTNPAQEWLAQLSQDAGSLASEDPIGGKLLIEMAEGRPGGGGGKGGGQGGGAPKVEVKKSVGFGNSGGGKKAGKKKGRK